MIPLTVQMGKWVKYVAIVVAVNLLLIYVYHASWEAPGTAFRVPVVREATTATRGDPGSWPDRAPQPRKFFLTRPQKNKVGEDSESDDDHFEPELAFAKRPPPPVQAVPQGRQIKSAPGPGPGSVVGRSQPKVTSDHKTVLSSHLNQTGVKAATIAKVIPSRPVISKVVNISEVSLLKT